MWSNSSIVAPDEASNVAAVITSFKSVAAVNNLATLRTDAKYVPDHVAVPLRACVRACVRACISCRTQEHTATKGVLTILKHEHV